MTSSAFLVATLARLLRGRRHIAVGTNLPIPAAAALLARELSHGTLRVDLLGSRKHNALTGLGDLFDFASQGRLDGFFLSPGQIDGSGNINLVGVGNYPRLDVRWPGSHGSPLLYMLIPNVILFRDTHLRRALVPKVDFISATGTSAPNFHRPGGPSALVTNLGCFSFDRPSRFQARIDSPRRTLQEILITPASRSMPGKPQSPSLCYPTVNECLCRSEGRISRDIADDRSGNECKASAEASCYVCLSEHLLEYIHVREGPTPTGPARQRVCCFCSSLRVRAPPPIRC